MTYFEFKLVDDAPEGKALAQILEKGYAEPYRLAGNEVTCIGIEFSKAKRSIVGWDAGVKHRSSAFRACRFIEPRMDSRVTDVSAEK